MTNEQTERTENSTGGGAVAGTFVRLYIAMLSDVM